MFIYIIYLTYIDSFVLFKMKKNVHAKSWSSGIQKLPRLPCCARSAPTKDSLCVHKELCLKKVRIQNGFMIWRFVNLLVFLPTHWHGQNAKPLNLVSKRSSESHGQRIHSPYDVRRKRIALLCSHSSTTSRHGSVCHFSSQFPAFPGPWKYH